jgi:hypothetical protein
VEAVLDISWPSGDVTLIRQRPRQLKPGRKSLAACCGRVLREARAAEPALRVGARVRELTNAAVIDGKPLQAILCPVLPRALVR